jgi:hypothetical protein
VVIVPLSIMGRERSAGFALAGEPFAISTLKSLVWLASGVG